MKKLIAVIGLTVLFLLPAFSQLPAGVPPDATNTVPALISFQAPEFPIATPDWIIGDDQINYSFVNAPVTGTYYLVEFNMDGEETDLWTQDTTAGGDIGSFGRECSNTGKPWYVIECFYALPAPPKAVEIRPNPRIIHRQIGRRKLR